jgi:hypothetical protein
MGNGLGKFILLRMVRMFKREFVKYPDCEVTKFRLLGDLITLTIDCVTKHNYHDENDIICQPYDGADYWLRLKIWELQFDLFINSIPFPEGTDSYANVVWMLNISIAELRVYLVKYLLSVDVYSRTFPLLSQREGLAPTVWEKGLLTFAIEYPSYYQGCQYIDHIKWVKEANK